jgi:hypothetical protein
MASFIKSNPKALCLGWAQTPTHPMWRLRWHTFGAKPSGRLEEIGQAVPWPELSTWAGLGLSIG